MRSIIAFQLLIVSMLILTIFAAIIAAMLR